MSEHIKEPWKTRGALIYDSESHYSIGHFNFEAQSMREASIKANRAVACVNALAGYNPAAIKSLVDTACEVCWAEDHEAAVIKLGKAIKTLKAEGEKSHE